ncbi:DUF1062 domain-containing protein [Actinoplanes sp. NPDC049596]|uniref:DUF1062 domain-containing protein n=1 Tax=unclassified Actinoplanes TaxID=2626549 RepID=UPI003428AC46
MTKPEEWVVLPTALPLIRRRCPSCSSQLFRAHGKFRVNANHKLLDVWLLALCAGCGQTIKLTVLERATVRAIDPSTLDRFHDNDPELAARVLADPAWQRRTNVTLDWTGAWTIQKTAAESPDVRVRFAARIPIHVTKLLSAGLAVPVSEVRRLVADGRLTSTHRLTGRVSADFGFTRVP